jgi:hypothetical protein
LTDAPQGGLIVVYDVNFIATAPTGVAVNEVAFLHNMENVVTSGGALPEPTPPAPPTPVPTLNEWGDDHLCNHYSLFEKGRLSGDIS